MSNVTETRDRSNIGEDDVGSDTDVDLDLGLHKGQQHNVGALMEPR